VRKGLVELFLEGAELILENVDQNGGVHAYSQWIGPRTWSK
jgi:hypothetical protein